nr:MAG TPA: hypothetical protein [Bacteriophage sp.]
MTQAEKEKMREEILIKCRTDILAYYRERQESLSTAIKEISALPDSQSRRDVQAQIRSLWDEAFSYHTALSKYYGNTFIKPVRTKDVLDLVIKAYWKWDSTLYDPA